MKEYPTFTMTPEGATTHWNGKDHVDLPDPKLWLNSYGPVCVLPVWPDLTINLGYLPGSLPTSCDVKTVRYRIYYYTKGRASSPYKLIWKQETEL